MIRDRRGTAMLEFALVAPVLVAMLYGTTELVRYVRTRALFYEATADLSQLVAAQQGVTSSSSGTLVDFCTGALFTLPSYPGLSASIASVTNTNGTIARDWEYDQACPTAGTNIGAAQAVTLGTPMVPTSGDSLIVVQASMTYTPIVSGYLPTKVFTATHYSRPRFGGPIPCTIPGTKGTVCPTLP